MTEAVVPIVVPIEEAFKDAKCANPCGATATHVRGSLLFCSKHAGENGLRFRPDSRPLQPRLGEVKALLQRTTDIVEGWGASVELTAAVVAISAARRAIQEVPGAEDLWKVPPSPLVRGNYDD